MLTRLLVLIAAALPLVAGAQLEMSSRTLEGIPAARATFRAPALKAIDLASLPAPLAKDAVTGLDAKGRLIVGPVRELAKSASVSTWIPVVGGFVTKFHVASAEATGLRAKLVLGAVPGAFEARVQGNDGRIESMIIDPTLGPEAWTPWTEGSEQVIELFSRVQPSPGAVSVAAVLHVAIGSLEKALAGSCTVPIQCTSNDANLDAAIATRAKSVAKMQFVDGSSGFLCTGTLINSERFPTPFFLTANHCISAAQVASTLTTVWFYDTQSCEVTAINPFYEQVTGGAQLVFTNYNIDSTLLQLNSMPPSGVSYSSWSATELSTGASIVSISHPHGDGTRYALGAIDEDFRFDRPQNFYGVKFSRGIIEGGSSGSGLFQLTNGELKLTGILFGSTVHGTGDGLTCSNLDEDALYGRFSILGPEIAQYLKIAPTAADDAPNRVQDFAAIPDTSTPLDAVPSTTTTLSRRIDYAGDLDLYRFTLQNTAYVSAWTTGAQDTVGSFLDSNGKNIVTNDDAQFVTPPNYNMGMTQRMLPGTYYVQVGHYDATGTGAYNFNLRADLLDDANYTDLWINANEGGWGVNVNHQSNTLFATLYTYDANGKGIWYSMSAGVKQPDGSYLGDLFRSTGPVFNAVPFTPITTANLTTVGTMRFTFPDADHGVLTYNVGTASVTKNIGRFVFAAPPTCTWSAFDRSFASNYTDLWWNHGENGWGVNIVHKANTIFATLFTYDSNGQPMWLVMSNGSMTTQDNFTGALFRTTGPAFNAVPFTPIGPANYTGVGNMTFAFTDGNTGTMTYTVNGATVVKQIERLAFGALKTQCSSD